MSQKIKFVKKRIMILLFLSSLYNCTSNKWTKSVKDIKFRDDVIFLNMELLANSYTYDFRTKTYELSVKSTYEIDFRDLVIEKGRYKIKGDLIELSPQIKLLFKLDEFGSNNILMTYETSGFIENPILVSKDTLTITKIRELGFEQRNLEINKISEKVELIEKGRRSVFRPVNSSY